MYGEGKQIQNLPLKVRGNTLAVVRDCSLKLRLLSHNAVRFASTTVVQRLTPEQALFYTLLARAPELEVIVSRFLDAQYTCRLLESVISLWCELSRPRTLLFGQ
jgi:hypothetical protein